MRADMHLSAEWLSRKQADTLAEQLQDLWREQGQGAPICFTWTDWIQNNALPFLGITERLLLTFNPHAAPVAAAAPQNSREREHAEDTRAGSSETRVEQGDECAESDVVRVAKLYTRLAAYSKMWDRQLFQEVSTPSIHPSISRSGMRQTCVLGLSSAHVTTLKLPQLLWCYGDALRVADVFWTPTSHSQVRCRRTTHAASAWRMWQGPASCGRAAATTRTAGTAFSSCAACMWQRALWKICAARSRTASSPLTARCTDTMVLHPSFCCRQPLCREVACEAHRQQEALCAINPCDTAFSRPCFVHRYSDSLWVSRHHVPKREACCGTPGRNNQ